MSKPAQPAKLPLKRILEPLIRLFLNRGITYPQLIQTMRQMFVDIAEQQIQANGEEPTLSRISIKTGIARKYVKEIQEKPTEETSSLDKTPLTIQLIAQWTTTPLFLTPEKAPRKLPRFRNNQSHLPCFEDLANNVSKDIRPKTLLDDLVEKNFARLNENDEVELLAKAYKPDINSSEMMTIFGDQIHDHIAAAGANISSSPPCFFDRSAYHDKLDHKSIEQLQEQTEELAMSMLQTLYAQAALLAADSDTGKRTKKPYRFRIGVYSYHDAYEDS